MADSYSHKATRAGEDLLMRLEREPEETLRRKWSCPGEHTIAAYSDGALGGYRRKWVEFHMSGCMRCRSLVADAVKAQRECDVAPAPPQLIEKARGLAVRQRPPLMWVWAPLGALAGIALLVALTMLTRKPEPTIARPASGPSAPLVAKSEPPPAHPALMPDLVRNRQIPANVPTLLSPQPGSVMRSDGLRISWKPIPRSRNYEVRIVKPYGDLIWKGEAAKSDLQLPSDVVLQDGSYFVWITASMEDGQTMKSAPVRFVVKRSQ